MTNSPDTQPINIGVIGLGYVGLPLCVQFARCGAEVLGLDIDQSKIKRLEACESYIDHIPTAAIVEICSAGKFSATSDFSKVAQLDAILICVPTPLNKNREPDLSYVLDTGRAIAPHLREGALVVLESTTYPGTTDGELREVLEVGSSKIAGEGFHLAYSPEREDPGNPDSRVGQIPKVVGGLTPACLARAVELYEMAVEKVVPVSSCRTAEATKLLENIFRSVNIALVNELKTVYAAMGIDIWEVIEAAKTKPFGYMPFYPGPGLGGHCIPIDPFYLTWKAREFGQQTRFIELAGEVNTKMPEYVVGEVARALNSVGKPVKDRRILIVGLAYKPDVDDIRESPSFVIMRLLAELGAQLDYYDPHVPDIMVTRSFPEFSGLQSIAWEQATLARFDLAIVVTAHRAIDYRELVNWVPLIVDTRNATAGIEVDERKVWKA